jgi:arylformamidase
MAAPELQFSRRVALGAAAFGGLAVGGAVAPAAAEGPPEPGPKVWMDMDQKALGAAFDQSVWAPDLPRLVRRFQTNSAQMRERIGQPTRFAYGPAVVERIDLYKTAKLSAPILVLIHGGAWRSATAADYAFPAEMVTAAGAHFLALDFAAIQDVGGDLGVLVDQVRRALIWTHAKAASFGGDPGRIFVVGHSSGGHLAGVMLTTDWTALGLPGDLIKGGICIGGLFDLTPVRLSPRAAYINFSDTMVEAFSPIRHLDRLAAPVALLSGTDESPEYQRQSKAFADAAQAAGRSATLIKGIGYNHFEMMETAANPFGVAGRAILARMGLGWR